MDLVGRAFDPDFEAHFIGLLAEPNAAVIVAANPAEVVLAKSQYRTIIEHAACLVAHRGIRNLANRDFAYVAGECALQQFLGVGAEHLKLAQRR